MADERELAFRYDLFVAPDWRDRFDMLISETVEMPARGRFLVVNCGTGASAIEMAIRLGKNGEVVAVDSSPGRLELARAKAQVQKLTNVSFEQSLPSDLPFGSNEFDAVVGDGSMVRTNALEDMLQEMIRIALPDAGVVLALSTRGSFDEFFSIYWEALLATEILDEVWPQLEQLINERLTISEAEAMAQRSGLRTIQTVSRREEFSFDGASEFLDSPMIKDNFLSEWLGIAPHSRRTDVFRNIASIIERERHGGTFEICVKATLVSGQK
jgi:ubiquinone/menaquinone biosynthesis C-methylase UbiE